MALGLFAACGGGTDQVASDLAALEQRVSELERTSGRYQARLGGIEEKVMLLEDRVEAHRLSLERRGAVRARAPEELPAYRPPAAEVDRRYLTDLPVQRLEPSDETPVDELDELVITNETLAQFVEERGGPPRAPTSQSGSRAPTSERGEARSATDASGRALEPRRPSRAGGTIADYEAALAHFHDRGYREALAGFTAFLEAGPPDNYQDNAHYWIGECHYALGDYTAALTYFERVLDEFPDGNKVPDSMLKIALIYEHLNEGQQASRVLARLIESYPTSNAAQRASQRLAELN